MKILLASEIGFCFGVKRAVNMVERLLNEVGKVYVVGSLIHNSLEMRRLERKGLKAVSDPEEVPQGAFAVVRSHGLKREEIELLVRRKVKLVDTTCPFVKRVRDVAQNLIREGYEVLLYGDPDHPEVQGLMSYLEGNVFVLRDERDLDFISISDKIGLVSQTTQELDAFLKIAVDLSGRAKEVRMVNTICNATIKRRRAVKDILSLSDALLVIGGKNSANTKKLVDLSKRYFKDRTYHIEFPKELSGRWFEGVGVLGVVSGASTPDWQVKVVLAILKKYGGEVCNGDGSGERKRILSH